MDIKSICAGSVGISGHWKLFPNSGRRVTSLVLSAAGQLICIMTERTTVTSPAADADIPCSYQSLLLFQLPSMSKLFGKTDFKWMRYPVHVILMALTMFYLDKNSFRNIALILRTVMNVQVSHTTISNWCTNFAPHSALNGLTPAQCAGLHLSKKRKRELLLVT